MVVLEDLTERRRAEAALADEQDRVANIIEGNGVGTWKLDVTTGLMAVNHRYLEIVGRVPSDALIDLAAEAHLVHPDDRPRRQALLGEHLRGRSERYASQHRLQVGDHWVWVLDTACVAVRNGRGRPVRVHGTLMDITVIKEAEAALRSSTDSLDRTGRLAEVGGWELEVASGRLTWSDETCRIHDLPPGFQPTLAGAVSFYEHDARETIAEAVKATMAAGTSYDLVLPLITAAGRRIVVRIVGTVERAADGTPQRLVGAVQDVTARAALERNLAESHELLQVTLQSIADAVITTHADGTVRWLNPKAEQLTGWTSGQASGHPLMEVFTIVDESTGETMGDPVERCLVADHPLVCHGELISRVVGRPNIEGTASAIRGQDGETMGGVLVFRDVSEQRRLAREMTHRAKHDPLTGLVNRTEFEQRLSSSLHDAVAYGSTHALLYLDLDQFKVVNDSCGHHVGDQMLQQVSSLLSNCIRTGDLVARLGGDEFGIVLDRCSSRHALAVAEDICERLEDSRFHHGEVSFRLSASIGLVPIDRRWPDSAALMQAADACCYAAKDAGRNRVYAWHETDVTTAERHTEMQRVSQIERAIDDDRFELFAQRIVPVDERTEDVHCEVLLRLRDIDGTIVPPGAFLPAAERYNLVGRVDRWVVRKVFDVLDASNGANGVATIAVNLSGQSIGDRNFHRFLFDLVARATFDVSILCFEITETAAITHLADAAAFIDGMRRLGVRISLDDFGSGVSSFGYLKSLTVDYLKIDGQFIRELVDDPLDRATVRCFQEVARVVGVQTIAEWVEVAETLAVLREIGVDYIQGYLTHRPEPLVDVLAQADAVAIATVGCATLGW